MTVAASSAVPSRLLLLTTMRPSSKYRHLFVGAQFGCGFEMSVDLKMFTDHQVPSSMQCEPLVLSGHDDDELNINPPTPCQ